MITSSKRISQRMLETKRVTVLHRCGSQRNESTLSSFGGQPIFSNKLNIHFHPLGQSFRDADEGNAQRSSLFSTFLLQLSDREYHVYRRSFTSEATLRLCIDAFSRDLQASKATRAKPFPTTLSREMSCQLL